MQELLSYQATCAEDFPGSPAESFLKRERGITPKTASRFGIGYDAEQSCIVFPYWRQDASIHRFKLRNENSQHYTPGEGVIPFGIPTLSGQEHVFVCEGETDTLRLAQELPERAVLGIPGASSLGCLEAYLPEGVTVYAVFDTDNAGQKATAKAIELYGARPVILPNEVKDVCAYFLAGYTLDDFQALVIAANSLAAETLSETTEFLRAAAEVGKLSKSSYIRPTLLKLSGQPEGYVLSKEVLTKLASLRPIEYDRVRKRVAKDASISVSSLDAEIILLRPKEKSSDNQQGSDLVFEIDEPWPWPVDDGAALLDDLAATFSRYCVLPDHGAVALALWSVYSFAYDDFYFAPILALTSAEKRCGKTTTLAVLNHLVSKPLPSSNVTPSSLFRAVERWTPTLLIDEADTFIKNNEDLRGMINSGHTRTSAKIIRSVGEGANFEPRCFSTWAPKVIAMIGDPPDTIEDRSIVIRLKRKGPSETVESIRLDRLPEITLNFRRRAARWVVDNHEVLKQADPDMPDGLNDRAADNWRPMIAIATLAGGMWPHLGRQAAIALSGNSKESSHRTKLLADIRKIFQDKELSDSLAPIW